MSSETDSTTQTRRAAIIGCGRMGHVHVERLIADGRARIIAVADDSLAAAERLRNQFSPDAAAFREIAPLLESASPELVVICTPTSAHFDQVSACLQHGTHVLCEKPLADSRERIDRLIADDATSPAHAAIAYQRRSWATYRTLRREVQSGRWGHVKSVTMRVTEDWQSTIGGTWRDDPQANFGGFVGDAGSHKIDAVFFVTGLAPREVYARSWKCGSQVEVVTMASAVLEHDVPLNMDFIGNAQSLREDLHIHCEQADLLIRDGRAWISRNNRTDPLAPLEPETNPVEAFLDVLDGTAENRAPLICARPVFDFTSAILESAAAECTIRLGS